jgi:glycosyltransferase involved in cell wall biosynthesis
MSSQFAHESGPEGDLAVLNADRASLRESVRFMRAGAADAIVVMGSAGNVTLLLAAWALKGRGTPVVLFTDANVPTGPLGGPRDWARHVLYRALRPIVDEAWTLGVSNEEALRAFGVAALRRLPLYATDFDALGVDAVAGRPPRTAGPVRLLCVARLSPEKNLRALCAALSSPGVAPRFELTLVGEGPERAPLEEAARRSPAPIRLLGAVPRREMREVFAAADALVLPSRWEPWGIAVVEALGLGLPVVATPRVGSAVSLAAGGGVVLAPGTDASALRGALAALADELPGLAAAARARSAAVRQEFGTAPVARRIAEALAALRARAEDRSH